MTNFSLMYSEALSRFLEALENREIEHNAKHYPNLEHATFSVNYGRVFDKIVRSSMGQRSVYAFIRKSNGAIIKSAGWKSPEPKKRERGNIYRVNPLEGTTIYGVAYLR